MGFGLFEGWRVIESEYWSVGELIGHWSVGMI